MRCDGSVKWLSKTHAMNEEGNELAKQKRHTHSSREEGEVDGGRGRGRQQGREYAWVVCVCKEQQFGAH